MVDPNLLMWNSCILVLSPLKVFPRQGLKLLKFLRTMLVLGRTQTWPVRVVRQHRFREQLLLKVMTLPLSLWKCVTVRLILCSAETLVLSIPLGSSMMWLTPGLPVVVLSVWMTLWSRILPTLLLSVPLTVWLTGSVSHRLMTVFLGVTISVAPALRGPVFPLRLVSTVNSRNSVVSLNISCCMKPRLFYN